MFKLPNNYFVHFFLTAITLITTLNVLNAQDDSTNEIDTVVFIQFTPTNRYNLNLNTLNNINPQIPTVFLIHGWHASEVIDMYLLNITAAYTDLNDRNVIYVDWSNTKEIEYLNVVYNSVPEVASKVGKMILLLHDNLQLDVSTIHIVGSTLGAHIAGLAGRYVQQHHADKANIGRITALEATGALFDKYFGFFHNPLSLRSTDATIVDVTHTNTLYYGSEENVGTVDFYVNGGETQTFCGTSTINDLLIPTPVNTCSHAFAIILYRLTINNDQYKASSDPETCENVVVYGDKLDKDITGVYYINTEDVWPYKTTC